MVPQSLLKNIRIGFKPWILSLNLKKADMPQKAEDFLYK